METKSRWRADFKKRIYFKVTPILSELIGSSGESRYLT
jgi:hypothetical protein